MAKPTRHQSLGQADSSAATSPRTGRLARGAIAGIAVARIGVAHARFKTGQLSADSHAEHEARLGRILFSALNQLKGTALKVSQLLSMELGVLPEGVRRELAQAHYRVTPLNRALVLKLLRQEFGQGPSELFEQFEPLAFAAASLGQVHAATLKTGETVAVKLQYPGMSASISSDLSLIRLLLQRLFTGQVQLPSAQIVDRLMAEVAVKLAQELDYQHEAAELTWFCDHLSLPELVVPRPVPTLSSQRVLTMQRLPGQHLNEWLQTAPGQSERDHYGQLLFDSFMHCAFRLRKIQADPHAGNFLFMSDGRLGLLDFGCTRTLSPVFCDAITSAWSAILSKPWQLERLHQAYQALGMVAPTLGLRAFEHELLPAIAPLLRWQRQPFTTAIFDFGQHPAPQSSLQQQKQAVLHLQSLPEDLPYFDRAWIGLLQLLKQLGARVRTTNPWIFEGKPA